MNYFNILSVVVLSLLLHDLIDGSLDIKPVIDTKYEETIKDTGDNFTVICLGHAPLEWVPPEIPEEYQDSTKIIINDIQSPKKDYLYAKQLFLQNLTFPFVGYYKCRVQGLREEDNERTSSKIYLFIRDEDQLSVDNGEIQLLYAVQYKTVTIPCRPTSPDVDVELTRSYGEKIVNNVPVDGIIYRYDPHYGFLTNDTEAVGEKILICKYQRDGKSSSTPYVLATELLVISISRPVIEEISGGHTVVGQQLKLICKVNCSARVTIEWVTPTGPPDPNRMNVSLLMNPLELGTYMQNLTINEARLEDKGVYYCKVTAQDRTSSNSINVTIFDVDEHFIELMEENDIYEISESITNNTKPISWRILVKGHPEPKLFWLNNRNQTIPNGETRKYIVNNQIKNEAVLTIKNITINDYGNYTLIARNDYETKHVSLFLNLTDKPSVHIESDEFLFINKPTLIKCVAIAHPKPQIFWHYKPCRHNNCTFILMKESHSKLEDLQLTSFLTLKINETGVVKCSANNSLGGDEAIQQVHVSDVENGLDIFGMPDSVVFDERKNQMIVARNDYFKMVCGASIENYTDGLQWYYNNKPIKANDDYNLHNSRTLYSYRVLLEINSMQKHNDGVYSCRIRTKQGDWINENVTIIVAEPTIPFINNTNLVKDIETVWPKPLELFCIVTGVPRPFIIWYKNGEVFQLPPNGRIKSIDRNQHLRFSYTEPNDEGNYKCEAANRIGRTSRQISLKISNKTADYSGLLIGLSLFFGILLFLSVLFIIRKIRIERKLQKELEIAGLAHFERGAIENLNPDLAVDDQAELLPYDKKWEFPIEKLKLGKQLGSGAFGVVLKGEAYGIVPGEDKTTVAVKMCKKNADYTYIKALASELKIMVHLGKHLNVVNLLGACTKNVAKRELLVIVEFCRFGNLHNYLLRHRDNFINQVDPKTEQIDFQIGQELLERTYSVSSNKSNPQSPNLKYAALSFSNNSNNIPTAMADYRGKNYSGVTAVTDTTLVTSSGAIGSEGMVISNNSVQPEWRSNYHGDYNKGVVRPICTKDLLTWTFQVSRGMEYLASRKVLHGDLAARNILLADNNVVKICDFGLAKSMYKSNNYKKRGDGPLPVKWMAIESIRDRVFSTQSDVWSFGIVLWEFFSLARTPYPGMEADEHLYNKLLDGYRMESPQYAPKEVYKMMLDCWRAKPAQRPTFTNLAERIGSMLEDSVRKHYIDLNDPYLMMNTQRIENGENDYLAMLSPPDYDKFSQPSPHDYVNDIQLTDNNSDGYLCMKPVEIFSPRPDDGRLFDFSDAKNKKNTPENGNLTEMVPMLRQTSTTDSDNESTCNSPSSFSNPSYHLPPIVERSDKDIVKGSDNYVNMPENKIKQDKISTKIDKQHHYVNNNSRDWESVKV